MIVLLDLVHCETNSIYRVSESMNIVHPGKFFVIHLSVSNKHKKPLELKRKKQVEMPKKGDKVTKSEIKNWIFPSGKINTLY